MVPGGGKPRTESEWTYGRGPKVVRKKQKMTVKDKVFLNIVGGKSVTLKG